LFVVRVAMLAFATAASRSVELANPRQAADLDGRLQRYVPKNTTAQCGAIALAVDRHARQKSMSTPAANGGIRYLCYKRYNACREIAAPEFQRGLSNR
jgi:hypothetical protein